MPEERKDKKLDSHYEEVDEKERLPNSEQRKWEEEQMSFAQFRFGAKDAAKKKKSKEYELVLDEQIEFVQALALPGNQKAQVSNYI